MNFIEKSFRHTRIWSAYCNLSSSSEEERAAAIETLKFLAPDSLPCLRFCIERQNLKRTQFAAAAALHQLGEPIQVSGEPLGMKTLTEALRLQLPHRADLAADLEAAYITIGEPDATTELLEVWSKLADFSDTNPVVVLICRVWAKLRDPRSLEALASRASRLPVLFEETIAPFNESALPVLEKLACSPDPYARILAIRALKKIIGVRSLNLLVPLLRDADVVVRAQVPQALLKTGWPAESVRQIGLAIEAGYSSPEAISVMETLGPINSPALIALIGRWNPGSRQNIGDTEASVFAALRVLEKTFPADAALSAALRDLLRRGISAALIAETIRVMGVVCLRETVLTAPIRDDILPFLASADDTVRGSAARTLALLGENLGAELEQLIAETRPQDSLLTKFQAVMQGGADAEAEVDKALQQVGGWLTRVTKETAGRLGGSAGLAAPAFTADVRLPALLNELLGNALTALERAERAEETAEQLALCIACLRAAPRFGAKEVAALHNALVRAFHCVKFGLLATRPTGAAMRIGDTQEIGRVIRREAGETLLQIYRAEAFPLFIEGLYASALDVRLTALAALGRLADARALPHIMPYLNYSYAPLARVSAEAVAAIRGANPEIMTLLRASAPQSDARPETLLRPAQGRGNATPPDQLLRPAPSE